MEKDVPIVVVKEVGKSFVGWNEAETGIELRFDP